MFPVILDITKLKILAIGNGEATVRRLALLQEAGCMPLHFKDIPTKLPKADIVFIADCDAENSAALYHMAKEQGAIVNVEDKKKWCDFHVPAVVRRGDLLLTISTGGGSPRLARRLRRIFERLIPAVWAERISHISQARTQWKREGLDILALASATDTLIDSRGWLKEICGCTECWCKSEATA